MVVWRSAHCDVRLHLSGRHVGSAWQGGDHGRASTWRLGRVRITYATPLRLEGGRHATTLTRTIAELVVRGVAHLVVVVVSVRPVSMAIAAVTVSLVVAPARTADIIALDRCVRLAAEVSAWLLGTESVGVGRNRTLSHVTLRRNMLACR